MYLSIFRNILLILGPVFTTFLFTNAYFGEVKPLAARMLPNIGTYAAGKNKVTQSDTHTVKLLQK